MSPLVARNSEPRQRPAAALRVLVVSNMYPTPEEPWFGSFVRDQIEDLERTGISVRVLVVEGRSDWRNYLRAATALRRALRSEPADLVHAHYGLTGAVALTQRRLPTVTTFHGSDFSGEIRWQKYVSWLVARGCRPIFVSANGRAALGIDEAEVIPAGVDTELFAPIGRSEARRALGWNERGHYALLPGSRARAVKRADLFDAAVREAGRSVAELRGVSLEGFSRRDAALAMNAVDVTVMTSDREGSPVAVRESLACMTPVVSVPVGDVPEVLAGLPGCSIARREPAAIGRAIVAALGSERRPELRTRAERDARPRVAERLIAFYERVLRERRGRLR
jgi:teichuronic acid biosynthesis glycosyltransferase TuaC